jgi:hypothetical protein
MNVRVRLSALPSLADRVAAVQALPARDRLRALRCLDPVARQAVWDNLRPEDRVAVVKAMAAPPEQCGGELPVAPARGRLLAFEAKRMEVTTAGNMREVSDGWAARVSDVFDLMEARRPKAQRRGGALFTASQVDVARDYRALVERVDASGLRGMSLETMRSGSGGGADGFIAAVLDDIARLRAMQRRIGDGVAMEVRRIRPSARGGDSRRGIRDRYLVDAVCLRQWTIVQVLESCGWSTGPSNRRALVAALAGALERMGRIVASGR